ncbi:NADPH-dependent FMN reductase [Lactobacillaceae bacterium 24-114]
MKKVGIIIGSTRPGRRSKMIADWLRKQLSQSTTVEFNEIDLKTMDLPFLDESKIPALGQYEHSYTKEWSKLIESYDGFVFVFPQYNWGYPAVLKNALDYLANEWKGKLVSLFSFGAHGGSQAQVAMRLVVTGFHMKQMAINPQLEISPTASPAEVERILHAHDDIAQLLRAEFEKDLTGK